MRVRGLKQGWRRNTKEESQRWPYRGSEEQCTLGNREKNRHLQSGESRSAGGLWSWSSPAEASDMEAGHPELGKNPEDWRGWKHEASG
ncbi:hypothetical protein GN956_G19473 [Arapaima gigas]